MDFLAEKVYFCGPGRPSPFKKSILMEGQIFDFWGDFTGKPLRTLTFLERFLNNFDFFSKKLRQNAFTPLDHKSLTCKTDVFRPSLTSFIGSKPGLEPAPAPAPAGFLPAENRRFLTSIFAG